MSLIEKLYFLCISDEILKRFLETLYDMYKDPWCPNKDLHSCNDLCSGTCEKIKFLIPVMEEMKKKKKTFPMNKKKVLLYLSV